MSKFGEFVSLYHSFCGGDDDNTENQIDDVAEDVNEENQDQLYAMITKSQESNAKPGNINRLLSKAHSKT